MRARLLLLFPLTAFAITLGIVVGQRLSQEAMVVLVGVVAGVAASIPTSLLTIWLVTRSQMPNVTVSAPMPQPAPPAEPRVIVVQSPPAASPHPASAFPTSPFPEPIRERQFNIIGGAEDA
jgi:hypothetical protein